MGRHLDVLTRQKEYRILWLQNLNQLSRFIQTEFSSSYALLVDENVALHYASFLKKTFEPQRILPVPAGESSKTLKRVEYYLNQFLKLGLNRQSIVFALGGGVTGDLAGFCAAIFMRGIEVVQIPTTLLAMVDSSIGGKTGVNLKLGKNMVGAFHQPKAVLMCLDFLKTLPRQEFKCGLVEAVKTALIRKPLFFRYLEDHVVEILNQKKEVLEQITYEAAHIKAQIVEKDERESGLRAILNFGHTLAHGLEAALDYKHITHGEAVAVGIEFATFFSVQKNYLPEPESQRIQELLAALSLSHQNILRYQSLPPVKKLMALMMHDKKNQENTLRFVFLDAIGKARLPEPVDSQEFQHYLEEFIKA